MIRFKKINLFGVLGFLWVEELRVGVVGDSSFFIDESAKVWAILFSVFSV